MSLRVLMVLVLALGGGLGWVVYRARVQRDAVAAIERAGGRVYYDWQLTDGMIQMARANPSFRHWLGRALGPDYFHDVVFVSLFPTGPGFKEVDDEVLAHLGRLVRVDQLQLWLTPAVTDVGMAHLGSLRKLRQLTLVSDGDYDGLVDRGLRHLSGMALLEELNVTIDVHDDALAYLANLKSLKRLQLGARYLTNDGLAHLSGLTLLELLHLNQSEATTAGLAHLRGLRHLREFHLFSTKVDSLEPIKHLSEIVELDLRWTKVDDHGLASLSGLPKLKLLKLEGTPVGDAGMDHLLHLPNLDGLILDGTRITDAGLLKLSEVATIHSVTVNNTAVTAKGIGASHARNPNLSIVQGYRIVARAQ